MGARGRARAATPVRRLARAAGAAPPAPGLLERHWLVPATPRALALLRIAAGGWTLAHLARRQRMLQRVAASDPALFAPVGAARLLREPLSPGAHTALLKGSQALNVLFVLGVRHRVTGPLHAAGLLGVLSHRNSFSMVYHTDQLPIWHAIVLGMAPAADALSVDALGRRGRRSGAAHRRYGWPIRLLNALTVSTYLLAGIAKLKGPLGWRWAGGGALRSQIAVDGLRKELMGDGASPLAFRLYTDRFAKGALGALAAGSLVVELGAPAALAHRRAGLAWAANAFAMHWGIFAVMKITFRYQMSGLAFAAFLADAASPRSAPAAPLARAERRRALVASAALLGAALWPVRENWRAEPRDGFLLSYYPMFTAKRRRRVRETYLLGLTAEGERVTLHYRLAGAGGLNLVRRQLRRMAVAGRGAEVCARAAASLARRGDAPEVVTVQLVTGQYRLEEYFRGERAPVKERVRAECAVPER